MPSIIIYAKEFGINIEQKKTVDFVDLALKIKIWKSKA